MSDPDGCTADVDITHLLLSQQWRALNYCLRLFGNIPLGQHFVHVTLMAVHARGWHPTVRELAAITGLTRPSVSRHLSALIAAGLVRNEVDSQDRRRRLLKPTRRGDELRAKLMLSLTRLNVRVAELAAQEGSRNVDTKTIQTLSRMAGLVCASPAGLSGQTDELAARRQKVRSKGGKKRIVQKLASSQQRTGEY